MPYRQSTLRVCHEVIAIATRHIGEGVLEYQINEDLTWVSVSVPVATLRQSRRCWQRCDNGDGRVTR